MLQEAAGRYREVVGLEWSVTNGPSGFYDPKLNLYGQPIHFFKEPTH